MAAEIGAYPRGSAAHLYVTSDGGANLDLLYSMVSQLPSHVRIVDQETLVAMALAREAGLAREAALTTPPSTPPSHCHCTGHSPAWCKVAPATKEACDRVSWCHWQCDPPPSTPATAAVAHSDVRASAAPCAATEPVAQLAVTKAVAPAHDVCTGHRCDTGACPCGCECGNATDPGVCYVPAHGSVVKAAEAAEA